MLATGGLLIAVAVLTLAAVAPLFRRADPPRWTTRGWIGELVTLAIVSTLAIGLGYLGAGVIGTVQAGPNYLDLVLLAVVLFVAGVIWHWLRARTRPRAVEADASGHLFAPASAARGPVGSRAEAATRARAPAAR
jgi:hypothetical protein